MSQPRRLYGALLSLLLLAVGLFVGPSPATASPRPARATCDPFLSDIFHSSRVRIKFQGQVTCNFTADLISIEIRIVPLSGSPTVKSRFVNNNNIAFLSTTRRCTPGTYAGTLAADAYRGGSVVASVRKSTQWFDITC